MDRDSIEKIRNARISISQLIYVNVISCYVLLYQIKVSYQFQNGKKLFKNAIYDSLLWATLLPVKGMKIDKNLLEFLE